MIIVDVDSHHYENECYDEFLPLIENDVLRQLIMAGRTKGRGQVHTGMTSFQDMGGRVTRYPLRFTEKTGKGGIRDVELAFRWMDALSVDYSCLFPTPLLGIGMHPDVDTEIQLCFAYNRWLTETVLPATQGRIYSMLALPFSDPDESLRCVERFGACKNITGFMITAVRTLPVHHNSYMKVYRAIEERGLALAFHSGVNSGEPIFKSLNRFASVHALGFPFYNILHMTNWITNGIGERFPKLPVIWIEGGLAWIPFLMQRLDHEYQMRTCEAPMLKKLPSEYMSDMFYTSQPLEKTNLNLLKATMECFKAETQLMYASDWPHWDFDPPSSITTLPFLNEQAKRNILGLNAARIFNLEVKRMRPKAKDVLAARPGVS